MTNTQVNYQELKDLYASDAKVKALFDLYASRRRARQDSTTPRMRRVLKAKGVEMSSTELGAFFRNMQKAGVGRCVFGRGGKASRFIWGFDLKTVAEAAQGKEGKLAAPPVDRVRLPKLPKLPRRPSKAAAPIATAPAPDAPVIPPAPVALPTQLTEDTRRVVVRKAGFEISLPLDMSMDDWKEAATFLNNLQSAG